MCFALPSARTTSLLAIIVSCKSSHELSQRAVIQVHACLLTALVGNRAKSKICGASWRQTSLQWPQVVFEWFCSLSFWRGCRCQMVLRALCCMPWLFLISSLAANNLFISVLRIPCATISCKGNMLLNGKRTKAGCCWTPPGLHQNTDTSSSPSVNGHRLCLARLQREQPQAGLARRARACLREPGPAALRGAGWRCDGHGALQPAGNALGGESSDTWERAGAARQKEHARSSCGRNQSSLIFYELRGKPAVSKERCGNESLKSRAV